MLKIENIGKNFGGVKAVDDLSFNVDKGEIVGLIGPNGSGKSTTINLICGVFPATWATSPWTTKTLVVSPLMNG